MYNPPAVTNHQNTNSLPPIEPSGSEAPARSTLARILASISPTRTGFAFHVMHNGKLSRRGIVLHETSKAFDVAYCDVFGLPVEMKRVSKEQTTSWKWFVDVEHSNVAYDKVFGVQ